MGGCPCPRCFVKKADLRNSGLAEDMKQRSECARRDNEEFRNLVLEARKAVYEKGYVVNSKTFDVRFKDGSWIPTTVSGYDASLYSLSDLYA